MANDGGLARIMQRLNAIPVRVKEAAAAAAIEGAEIIADDARHFAQASKDSGDLIDSIEVTPAGQSTPEYSQPGGRTVVPEGAAMVTVGNDQVRYPHLIEYGTKTADAQTYFWPAVDLNKKKVASKMRRAIAKAAKESWGSK